MSDENPPTPEEFEEGREIAQAIVAATFHGENGQLQQLLQGVHDDPKLAVGAAAWEATFAVQVLQTTARRFGIDAEAVMQRIFAGLEPED